MPFDKETFDLFPFLSALNKRDLSAYTRLSAEGKKAAHPLVIMRWLSGTSDHAQIIRLNEFANKYVFSLGAEKALLFKLLAAACTGQSSRASWIKGPGGAGTKLALEAVKSKFECSTREAVEYLKIISAEDVLQYAESAGWEKDQLKKLTLELQKDDTGQGRVKKISGK
jgi:hypothetical protein